VEGIAELLDLITRYDLGPIATIVAGVIYLWNRYSKLREAEHKAEIEIREKEVKQREKENQLRHMKIQLDRALLKFLKGEGHDIEIPDLTREIL
jgi:hypothetical protein